MVERIKVRFFFENGRIYPLQPDFAQIIGIYNIAGRKPIPMSAEHHKKESQIERIIFFSDAVFAIAITLLVIELKVPHLDISLSDRDIWITLRNMSQQFIGFILSFYVIAIFWITHHKIMSYLVAYNRKLIWKNMHLLFWIAFMPFSSALYSEYLYRQPVLIWYSLNIIIVGLKVMDLWNYISNPKNKLSKGLENRKYVEYNFMRALVAPFAFLLAIVLSFVNMKYAYFSPVSILFIIPLLKRRYKDVAPHWD